MPFSGPGYGFQAQQLPEFQELMLRRQDDQTAFDRAMTQAEQTTRQSAATRFIGPRDEGMSPAPARGGRSVADSPLLNRDMMLTAARTAGEADATKQNTEQQSRYNTLKTIPGISPTMAARIVFGRSNVDDADDPSEMRSALARFVDSPSRDTASAAVRAGAALNTFPDRFLGGAEPAPTRGTPEWFQMREQELSQEFGYDEMARRTSDARAGRSAVAGEFRSARSDLRGREDAFRSTMHQRPTINDVRFRDPITRTPDSTAFADANSRWQSDSTASADAVSQARDYLGLIAAPAGGGAPERSSGASTTGSAPIPGANEPAGGGSEQQVMALETQDAIRKVVQSQLPKAEKDKRIQMINQRFKQWLQGGR